VKLLADLSTRLKLGEHIFYSSLQLCICCKHFDTQEFLARQNLKLFGISTHFMFIGLFVVPSLLISNLYENSSLNIQSLIGRVNDCGRRSSSSRI